MLPPLNEARIVFPTDLVGAATVCEVLKIGRSTLSRRIAAGKLEPLAQLDGPRGAFVFLLSELRETDS